MKKFTWVLGVILIVLIASPLFAAGTKEKVKDGYTFGYIAYDMQDIWNMYGAQAFEYAADQVGVKTIVLDSGNSLERSVAAMEDLIQKQVDGISVFPISPDQVATLIKMANDAGIPITVENLPPPENAGDYISTVACLYGDIGYAAIKFISETMPGARIFYAAGAKGGGVYEQYQEGVDKALKEFTNVKIVGLEHGDWQTEMAMNVTQNFIQTGTKFDVIFANNDLMAKGSYNALVEAGLKHIPIISTGGSPDGIQMMKDGIEAANMTAPVSIQGVQTFKNLYQYVVQGKRDLPKFTPLPIVPATAAEIDKVITWEDPQKALDYIGGL
ncbi:MAG: LacI family transcriptional regulator [Spirochaetae bacterium HGW-Spirochaetae-2]|jgi:ABC-type sugar transport system substrate-binding protein|nr:MAG: LacI family transcriptional regulator [Spirochaetae bacterium HGW-Spirochaetae-2]